MYFVKSFPDDFKWLERVTEWVRIIHQTTQDILDNLYLDTNTVSFWRWQRLCTTFLDTNYTQTYRKQGIIFVLPESVVPDYIFPFDLNCISQQDNPEVEYAKMRSDLQKHYGPRMIPWFEEFQSRTYGEMKAKFADKNWEVHPLEVLRKVNIFREKNGWAPLSEIDHLKLFTYNEAIFLKWITMKCVWIYGTTNEAKYWAMHYDLPLYDSADAFYNTIT